jgi:hypothetical protein
MWRRKRDRELALPGVGEEVPAALKEWSQALDVSRVTHHTVREAEYYLKHYRHMMPTSRKGPSFRLMALLAEQVSPPPPLTVAPLDAVGTVLRAVRERGVTSDHLDAG